MNTLCRCCLSGNAPLNSIVNDKIIFTLFRCLLGYSEDHNSSHNGVCCKCERILNKIVSFQDICKEADYVLNKYNAQCISNQSNNERNIETCQMLSSKFYRLACSGVQSVDVPPIDRQLIRRRPVNIVTLPQPLNSAFENDSNQIILSIKNPVDVNEEEDVNQCEVDDFMLFDSELSTVDDDSYFDFTIVVKNDVEETRIKNYAVDSGSDKIILGTIPLSMDKLYEKQVFNINLGSGLNTEINSIKKFPSQRASISMEKDSRLDYEKNSNSMNNIDDEDGTIKGHSDVNSQLFHLNDGIILKVKEEDITVALDDCDQLNHSGEEDFIKNSGLYDEIFELENQKVNVLERREKIKKITKTKRKKNGKLNGKNGNKKRFRCEICSLVFDLAVHLEIHNSTHTGLSNFVCDLCCRSFPLKSTLEKHIACHSCDRKRFKCDQCPKTFIFKKLLIKHMFKHTNESKPFVCSICSRGFVFENDLKRHMLLHSNVRPYLCPKCPKKFTQKAFLSQHLLTHVEGERFICDICGKGFGQSAKLSYHRKTHLEVKPFQCDLCPRSFIRSGQLKTHKIYHSDERPWICEHCGRSFRVKGALTAHERVHSGARPYKCDICLQSYTEAGYLKKHKRIHTGIKPFSCEVCGRSFNETCTLARHRLTHSDERKHVCQECGGRFKYSGCLNKHIQRKHNGSRPPAAS